MPDKCCVPGCNANYRSNKEAGYTSIFKLPNDPCQRNQWLKNIPRKDWTPGTRTVVCSKHFEPTCISTVETYVDANGDSKTFPRKRPLLLPGSVPTLFPNLPKYLSTTEPALRINPEDRKKAVLKRLEDANEKFLNSDKVQCFNELCDNFKTKIPLTVLTEWNYVIIQQKLCFYRLDLEDIPTIVCSLKINSELKLELCENNCYILYDELSWIMDKSMKIKTWSQLESILIRYKGRNVSNFNRNSLVENVVVNLERLYSFLKNDNDNDNDMILSKLEFLREQFELIFVSSTVRRYSPSMILNSFLIYMQSASCYNVLRENYLLTLPHPKSIQKLFSNFNIAVNKPLENEHFIKSMVKKLSTREKIIIVQVDEIYVNGNIDYKNGQLYGCAQNNSVLSAKTIVAFMISSAFGKFKEVVSLIPVHNVTGKELAEMTIKTCQLLVACDLKPLAIISDNNRVNRVMFNELAKNSKDKYSFQLSQEFQTFLTYDSIHIFKNIRNNWINQKDSNKSFVFPCFHDNTILSAKFSDIRDLYKKESDKLLKLAPKLNYKSVFPSTLDRQKVSLVANIFHESTLTAVKSEYGPDCGTSHFLELIVKWWTIVNIKSSIKHILHNNSLEEPFGDIKDERLKFLSDFFDWLARWKSLNLGYGFLTEDTYNALQQNVYVMITIMKHSLSVLKMPYILPGKLQTDNSEGRFSRYRQLSGGNYHVSVIQIIESEKKLRIKSILGLHSAKYGKISFSFEGLSELSNIDQIESTEIDDNSFITIFDKEGFLDNIDSMDSALLYICGYSVFKTIKRKLSCYLCIELLKSDESGDEYLSELNRGSLTVPSAVVIVIAKHIYSIVQHLISSEYENLFLAFIKQKELIVQLTIKSFSYDPLLYNLLEISCDCGQLYRDLFYNLLNPMANILLNNYTKLKNSYFQNSKLAKKRKLQTLS